MIHPTETIICAIDKLCDVDDHMRNLLAMLVISVDGLIIAQNDSHKKAENLKILLELEKKGRMKLSTTDIMARKDLKRVNRELTEAKQQVKDLQHDLAINDKAYQELMEERGHTN